VGKGGRETSIDAPRRVRRAHAEQLNLPKGFAWPRRHSPSQMMSAFAHLCCVNPTGALAGIPIVRYDAGKNTTKAERETT
jgi:hypothetical protein